MGNVYVVSRRADMPDGEYETAVVFNATTKDADNEAAANDYRAECIALRPWQQHTVLSADEFADAYPEKSDDAVSDADFETAPAPDADPVPGDATPAPSEH